MATFAPNLQTQGDPEYLRYSKPISQPEGNKAGYYLAKGLGDAVEGGLENADKVVSRYAENTAYEEGKQKQDEMEKAIDPIYRQVVLGENTNSSTTPGPMQFAENQPSLVQGNKDIPPEISNGTKQATSLNERFKNGKITQTDYDSEIDKLAKDLNSRFPAWRNEIGKGLSRATGRDNANLSIADKIRDINTIMSQLGQEKNKVTNEILSAKWGDPATGQKLYDDYINGRTSASEAMFQVFKQRALDANTERALKMHEMNKASKEETQWKTQNNADQIASSAIDTWQQNFEIKSGFKSPAEMESKLLDLINNPNDVEAQRLGQAYALSIPLFKRDLTRQLSKMSADLGGQEAVNRIVEQHVKPYEDMIALMSDPTKVGSVLYGAKHLAEATQRQMQGIISQNELGRQTMGIKALTDLSGDIGAKFTSNLIANRKDFGEQQAKMSEEFKLKAMSVGPDDRRPPSINDAILRAHDFNPNPKVMDDYINFLTNIKDKGVPDDVAKKVAYAYYSPANRELIGNWSSKTMDPKTGNTIPGQVNVLKQMSSKDVLDRIKSLNDPKLNTYVKDFLEHSASSIVFPSLMRDTESMVKAAGDRLGYDDQHQRFYLTPKTGTSISSSPFIQTTVHRLNFAIESMQNVADFVGAKDKNGYIIGLLAANNPNLFSKEVKGFPSEINQAIANQVKAKLADEMKKSKAKKDLEQK